MDGQTLKLLLSLVSSAVFGHLITEDDKQLLNDEKLRELVTVAEKYKLLPIVVQALFLNGLLDDGTPLLKGLKKLQIKYVYRVQQWEYELDRICETLESSDIDFVPLKGAVIRNLYPEQWMRTSCDIDVLVETERVHKACEILVQKLGYTANKHGSYDIKLLTPSEIYLELHYSLVDNGLGRDVTHALEGTWEHTETSEGCEHHRVFSNEFLMLYHIIHMAKHMFSGGCGIRAFVDLKLMREKLQYDAQKFSDLLKNTSMLTFYNVCCELCEVWFTEKEHSEITKRLENYVLSGGAYGTCKNYAAVEQIKGRSKAKQFFDLLFLSAENMKRNYPILNKRPWLLPFYHIIRWFNVFNKSKRRRIDTIISANDSVTDENIAEILSLMTDLELKK